MKYSATIKKLSAAAAVAFALGAPLFAASAASAEPYRIEHQRGYQHAKMRIDHRSEFGYRDLFWRHGRHEHMRFEHRHFGHDRFYR